MVVFFLGGFVGPGKRSKKQNHQREGLESGVVGITLVSSPDSWKL